MSKRRRQLAGDGSRIVGDTTVNVLKPVINLDVPKDASILNVNFVVKDGYEINDDKSLPGDPTGQYQWYGDVFNYKFPQCDVACFPRMGPNVMMDTHQIFDIDLDTMNKSRIPIYTADSIKPGTSALEEDRFTDGGDTEQFKDSGIETWNSFKAVERGHLYFVLNKRKQKALGDWIATYWNTQKRVGVITHWLFDRFCSEVKPMFARYTYYVPTSSSFVPTAEMLKPGVQPTAGSVEFPTNTSIVQVNGQWESRDFHIRKDMKNLTPTDTYANELLIGNLGRGLNSHLKFGAFKIYHKKARVNAQTLFFQENVEFMAPSWKGDRKEYGTKDWVGGDGPANLVLENAVFDGVVTCSEGTCEYFADGKLNEVKVDTNILQDLSTGKWY